MQNETNWCSLSAESAIMELKSNSEKGLSAAQINAGKKIYGSNTLIQRGKKNIFIKFLEQFKDLMVIILIAAAAISVAASYISGDNDVIDQS